MSFSDETIKAKLSALNETQDSIVSVAQWIMFYRRYADRAAQIWLEKLKESNSSKKLNLVYLANEIMQQAKSRRKEDFLHAFMPIIAEAIAASYKGATQEVQLKIRRVVEVWRERKILDDGIQAATEGRIDEMDKTKSTKGGARLGGSLFGSSTIPTELQPLTQTHAAISKAETTARPLVAKASADYNEQTSPDALQLSPPVQAGKLSALLKSLASAESAVNDSIKARNGLIQGLEKILQTHKSKLAEEEITRTEIASRKANMEIRRKEVEDSILGRVTAEEANGYSPTNSNVVPGGPIGNGDQRPEIEGFTPPPPDMESFTPNGSPQLKAQPQMIAAGQAEDELEVDTYAADPIQEQPPKHDELPPSYELPPAVESHSSKGASNAPGFDLLASLNIPGVRSSSTANGDIVDPRKRRKMSHKSDDVDDQFFAGEDMGLDADVAANLGA